MSSKRASTVHDDCHGEGPRRPHLTREDERKSSSCWRLIGTGQSLSPLPFEGFLNIIIITIISGGCVPTAVGSSPPRHPSQSHGK